MLRFYREPLLPQQVTSSKPCKDDSITPLKSLQEIKMKFFNHPFLFGTIKGLSQSMSCREPAMVENGLPSPSRAPVFAPIEPKPSPQNLNSMKRPLKETAGGFV
jgi:hypothetical protein